MADAPVDHGQMNRTTVNHKINNTVGGSAVGGGSFTATAAAQTTITDSDIPSSATIVITPTSVPASRLLQDKRWSVVATTGGFNFNVSATGAGAPAGTETYSYIFVVND